MDGMMLMMTGSRGRQAGNKCLVLLLSLLKVAVKQLQQGATHTQAAGALMLWRAWMI
jgi:DNA-binding transcriptional regulator YdaS (Cro superfamily)